jgi:hypothetical protein
MGLIANGIHGMNCLAGFMGSKKKPPQTAVSFARTWHNKFVSMPVGYYNKALILPLSIGGVAMYAGGAGALTAAIKAEGTPAATLSGTGAMSGHLTGLKNSPCTMSGTGTMSAAIKGKTRLSCVVQIGSKPSAEDIAWAVLDTSLVETGLTVRQALKLMAAAMAGTISGAETSTVRIRSAVADDKERITATVDGDGNRTAITVDIT